MHVDLNISTYCNVIFIQQPSVLELDFYKDLRCHRVKATFNIKDFVFTSKIR